ncbi:hypothetical protein Ciccas_004130 [Cichlidogyrus casuarinus]|uniref:FIST C-domain domain-containing protein n=1 Tax=Cichlidogyrus casuarinus TaxID=1844966 RepID=A0ABD2QCD2_9PLAT
MRTTFDDHWNQHAFDTSNEQFAKDYYKFLEYSLPDKVWAVAACGASPYDGFKFGREISTPENYQIVGRSSGKNGIVVSIRNEKPEMAVSQIYEEMVQLKTKWEAETCCTIFCKGGLYYQTVTQLTYEYQQSFPKFQIVGAVDYLNLFVAGSADRVLKISLGPTYCIVEKVDIWVML